VLEVLKRRFYIRSVTFVTNLHKHEFKGQLPMLKLKLLTVMLIFLLAMVLPVAAQDPQQTEEPAAEPPPADAGAADATTEQVAPAWEVILLDTETGQVFSATPAGIQPTVAIAGYQDFTNVIQQTGSPDRQKMAFVGLQRSSEDQPTTMGIYVSDLTTGECCTQLPDPIPSGMTQASLGAFNADGTQFAALVSNPFGIGENEGDLSASFVTIYDLTTNAIAASLAPSVLQDDITIASIAFGGWDENGLALAPLCLACETPDQAAYRVWHPSTDTVEVTDRQYNAAYRVLDGTGEVIFTQASPDYPSAAEEGAAYMPPNVIVYRPDTTAEAAESVIYFNPNARHITSAAWVIDGSAVLATHPGTTQVTLIYRDGSQIVLDLGVESVILTGTPDGWLMINQTQLVHYSAIDNQFLANPLGQAGERVGAVYVPALGSGVTPGFVAQQ
jgi:hypothetical protein